MASLQDLRRPIYRIIDPATRALIRWRIHPNAITTAGFAVTLLAGYLFHLDHVRWAGFCVLMGGLSDIFDGRVARESGLASKFGAFYDATLDRLSEIVVFIGLISLYNQYGRELGDAWMIYVIAVAIGGSLMVSYTRAKAEALGLDCNVGFMQRAERLVLLGGGSLFFGLMWDGLVLKGILILLAVTTILTTIQRIVWVYRHAAGVPLDETPAPKTTSDGAQT
ncbi:MAG: CDP-alcohol phosphatidyltransferase family protein [Gemmatimonadales bacterium]|nr:MAG: CDP-alcohol phosphatidyltransferase family protein [Gemmatimonadales bacterium]